MMSPPRPHPTRASSLLIALWALLVLAAAVLAWARFVDAEIALSNLGNRGLEARAYAHSGLVLAMHPDVKKGSPLLEMEEAEGRGFRVRKIGEGGKLNINIILKNPNRAGLDFLKRLLAEYGMDYRERETYVACMIDWIDQDPLVSPGGREAGGDYRPPNLGFFRDIGEMAQVSGAAPLLKNGRWRDGFTLYSNGSIDILSAPIEVLRALPGVSPRSAATFLALRRGPDEVDGTRDDHVFKGGLPEAFSYLGINANQLAGVNIRLESEYWRIESTGRSGDTARQIDVIARVQQNNQPTILSWTEK